MISALFFVNTNLLEASRKKLNLPQEMKKSDIMHWTTEIHDKFFHIYVDRNTETIFIQGEVDNWSEKNKVEEYLRLRSPNTYQLFCLIDIKD